MDNNIKKEFNRIENLKIEQDKPLKSYTTFKVGGPADIVLTPLNCQALINSIKIIGKDNIPFFILGEGSNVIVSDSGFRGIIIYTGQLNKIEIQKNTITAETGVALNSLASRALEAGLSGLEFTSGIPGSLGGAIYMNAGAYGREIKDVIEKATVINYQGEKSILNKEELHLSYRHSILQEKPLIFIKGVLRLTRANKNKISELMKELNQKRRKKQPLQWPSAGSTFKRPENNYAGSLVEKAGMKGARIGDAQVSEKHAGFIVNLGNARARDIKKLIKKIQDKVYEMSGIRLEPEPRFIGDFD